MASGHRFPPRQLTAGAAGRTRAGMSENRSKQSADPAAGGSWRSAIRGNVLMMGLVSMFTDFSSEMMNPLLPIFIAGLGGGAKQAK